MAPWGRTHRWDPRVELYGGTCKWNLSETVKPDGQESMTKNCLNLTTVTGTIFNLNKRKEKKNNWIELGPILGSRVPLFQNVGLKTCNFYLEETPAQVFPVNIVNFLRAIVGIIFSKILWWFFLTCFRFVFFVYF